MPETRQPPLEHWHDHLDRELTGFAEALGAAAASEQLDRPITHCPGWTVRDLTAHLIELHTWVADAVAGGPGTVPSRTTPVLAADEDLPAAFTRSAARLRAALDHPPQTPSWTFAHDHTVGFWHRRQPHEHAIHRWDLEAALGRTESPDRVLDPELSADGVDEVIGFFWPRQVALGRATAPTDRLRLVATDAGREWILGDPETATDAAPVDSSPVPTNPVPTTPGPTTPGPTTPGTAPPVATVSGTAAQLALLLWGRLAAPTLAWDGDTDRGAAVLRRAITP